MAEEIVPDYCIQLFTPNILLDKNQNSVYTCRYTCIYILYFASNSPGCTLYTESNKTPCCTLINKDKGIYCLFFFFIQDICTILLQNHCIDQIIDYCKVCQWLATGWWFSLATSISSSNKTDLLGIHCSWNIVESDVKHHKHNQPNDLYIYIVDK